MTGMLSDRPPAACQITCRVAYPFDVSLRAPGVQSRFGVWARFHLSVVRNSCPIVPIVRGMRSNRDSLYRHLERRK
jgi:hypothetical protein